MKQSYLNDEFFSRLESLAFNLRKDLGGFFGGKHLVSTYGQTVEFADYREYMLGDDIRRIDWNLYSRFEKYFIKLFTDERQMHVHIYIDCSASMGKVNPNKGAYAIAVAAAIGYLAIHNMDKVSYHLIKGAKAENRPGVTRGKQWVSVDRSLQLLDTPGILWPKFEDPEVGLKLAYTGAVKEGVIDLEELACRLMELLHKYYPAALADRYKVEAEPGTPGYQLLEQAGKNRGFLLARGEIHTERMAKVLIDEFRSGKLGRFTLEIPEEMR